MNKPCVYHIEDNEGDRRLLAFALEAQGVPLDLYAANDGEHALALLGEASAGARCRPDLIILDLNLPKLSGIEVLERIRNNPHLQHAPVVVLTSSDSPADRTQTEALGIKAYLRKPMNLDGFIELGGDLLRIVSGQA